MGTSRPKFSPLNKQKLKGLKSLPLTFFWLDGGFYQFLKPKESPTRTPAKPRPYTHFLPLEGGERLGASFGFSLSRHPPNPGRDKTGTGQ